MRFSKLLIARSLACLHCVALFTLLSCCLWKSIILLSFHILHFSLIICDCPLSTVHCAVDNCGNSDKADSYLSSNPTITCGRPIANGLITLLVDCGNCGWIHFIFALFTSATGLQWMALQLHQVSIVAITLARLLVNHRLQLSGNYCNDALNS